MLNSLSTPVYLIYEQQIFEVSISKSVILGLRKIQVKLPNKDIKNKIDKTVDKEEKNTRNVKI